MLGGSGEPAPECLPPTRGRREQNTMRAGGALGATALLDVAELSEHGDRPIDERPADGPDLPDVAVGGECAREIPPVCGPLSQEPEHGPLGERRLGAGRACHQAIVRTVPDTSW